MSKPTFTFYYSVDNSQPGKSVVEKLKIGSTSLIETIHGTTYCKNKEIIGTYAICQTLYEIRPTDVVNTLYDSSGQLTFYFKDGAIQTNIALQLTKIADGKYVSSSGEKIKKIVSGTGKYLNATGTIKISVDNVSLERKVEVFLDKSCGC
jgi:hypothetical protein